MEELDEGSIDVEDLQAQIDLSMSFAQNLVSSWVKPRKLGVNTRTADLESELLESIRRPPRLGVGAVVSEKQSTSRETARLKGQIIGKKRPREEKFGLKTEEYDPGDNEEESRAGSIKKKPKVDPFDTTKRKKKATIEINGITTPLPVRQAGVTPSSIEDQAAEETPSSSPKNPRKKRKHSKHQGKGVDDQDTGISVSKSLVVNRNTPHSVLVSKPISEIAITQAIVFTSAPPILSKSPEIMDNVNLDTVLSPKITVPSSLSLSTPGKRLPVQLLSQLLLNLQQPSPSEAGSESELPNEVASASPKKKRKRRKKKKRQSLEGLPHTTNSGSPELTGLIS